MPRELCSDCYDGFAILCDLLFCLCGCHEVNVNVRGGC